jgi:putative ATP-dependent endonuclease of OLD family
MIREPTGGEMKLEAANITNYRSIRRLELANCGQLNVLIGKNNSGKSNILSAINAFFDCTADIVTLRPPIGRDIDFHRGAEGEPIEITLRFLLSLAERDEIVRDIATEAPQMKNAVDGLDPSLRLLVTVTVSPSGTPFAYISLIGLAPPHKSVNNMSDGKRVLLSVNPEAAGELHDKQSIMARTQRKAAATRNAIARIDEPIWSRLRRTPDAARDPYLLSSFLTDSEVIELVGSLAGSSNSYAEFQGALRTYADNEVLTAKRLSNEPLQRKVHTFAGDSELIPNYSRNILHRLLEFSVLYLRERRNPVGPDEAQHLLSLKVRRGGPEILKTIQETVSTLLGVNIDAFESAPPPRGSTPIGARTRATNTGRERRMAEMDVDDFLVEVNGSGIREALRLILDTQLHTPTILLIEEPEVHLHPALETSVMRYLRQVSADCQVFLSTHSTNFLDTAEMRNVYLVSTPASSTEVQLLNLDEAEAQIPSELGIRLSSVFMYDRLVFVEGPSDEGILRELASKLDINLSKANVGFVHMGGVKNFTHYASEATLRFLTRRQVEMWFLLDRDEVEDSEVEALVGRFEGRAKVHVLEKRELENYLLHRRAISELIRVKAQLANLADVEAPPDEAVADAMEEESEKLKQFAVEKRAYRILCRPVFPRAKWVFEEGMDSSFGDRLSTEIDRMARNLETQKDRVDKVLAEQSAVVERRWPRDKYDLVPGDLLLDHVCSRFGVRFRKERDGSRLASLMKSDEVAAEIALFLRDIAS